MLDEKMLLSLPRTANEGTIPSEKVKAGLALTKKALELVFRDKPEHMFIEVTWASEKDGRRYDHAVLPQTIAEALEVIEILTAMGFHVSYSYTAKQYDGPPEQLHHRCNWKQVAWIITMVWDLEFLAKGEHQAPMRRGDPGFMKILTILHDHLPRWIRRAIRYVVLTGGGLQIYLALRKPVFGQEPIRLIADYMKNAVLQSEALKEIVDPGSFDFSRPQRVPGSLNFKVEYAQGPSGEPPLVELLDAAEFFPDDPFEEIDSDQLLANATALAEAVKANATPPNEKYGEQAEALRDQSLIALIKRSVPMLSIHDKGHKPSPDGFCDVISCPHELGHDHGDIHPSASLIHTDKGDIIRCHRENKTLDVVDVVGIKLGKGVKDSIEYLAQKIGKKATWQPAKLKKAEDAAAAKRFDPHAYLNLIGVDTEAIIIVTDREGGGGSYAKFGLRQKSTGQYFTVRDRDVISERGWEMLLLRFAPDIVPPPLTKLTRRALLQAINGLAKWETESDMNSPEMVTTILDQIVNGEDIDISEFLKPADPLLGETTPPRSWLQLCRKKRSGGNFLPVSFRATHRWNGQEQSCFMVEPMALMEALKKIGFRWEIQDLYQWLKNHGFEQGKFYRHGEEPRLWATPIERLKSMAKVNDGAAPSAPNTSRNGGAQ